MSLGLMVFFRSDNLPGIKDGMYVINLDDKESKETYWVSLFIDRNATMYFHSLGTTIFLKCIKENNR